LGFSLARAEIPPTNGWKATSDRELERHQLAPPKLENPTLAGSCVQDGSLRLAVVDREVQLGYVYVLYISDVFVPFFKNALCIFHVQRMLCLPGSNMDTA
jgi:hypothetical protein